MLLDLHIIQNFAPSNLNRDDTNAPKDCEFGGFRRARISSQCIKRSVRTEFSRANLIASENLSYRTRKLVDAIVAQLVRNERDNAQAQSIAEFAIRSAGLGMKDSKTQYLLFLGVEQIREFSKLIDDNWDELVKAVVSQEAEGQGGKSAKKKAKADAPGFLKDGAALLLDGSKAADLALFGRMLADLPNHSITAACQVAHAISTNKVEMEFDFYTAVDDLQPAGESGAGMMGTVEFNSSCFYRYANLDTARLIDNLGHDTELAEETITAFLRAFVLAVPTGKQNSMAAQNPPSFVLAVVRSSGLCSLANAFVKPVWPRKDEDLVGASIRRLDSYWKQICDVYGSTMIRDIAVVTTEPEALANLASACVSTSDSGPALDVLVTRVRDAIFRKGASA